MGNVLGKDNLLGDEEGTTRPRHNGSAELEETKSTSGSPTTTTNNVINREKEPLPSSTGRPPTVIASTTKERKSNVAILADKCQENNTKILDLQRKIKEKDQQHTASLKKAVEMERIRITSLWEKDKKNHQLQVMSMQQQFNQYLLGDKQQHQLAAKEERRGALERATTFFSKREDLLTALDQYPILKQLTSTCASSRVNEQSVKLEGDMKTDTTADAAAASVLLELKNNVPEKQETTCTDVADVQAETRASRAKNIKAVGQNKKTSTEKGSQHQRRWPSNARATPQPPSRRSPLNHGKRLRVPEPNLQEALQGVPLPAFRIPEYLTVEPKAKRRKTRRTKLV